jgi:hypothetical protein
MGEKSRLSYAFDRNGIPQIVLGSVFAAVFIEIVHAPLFCLIVPVEDRVQRLTALRRSAVACAAFAGELVVAVTRSTMTRRTGPGAEMSRVSTVDNISVRPGDSHLEIAIIPVLTVWSALCASRCEVPVFFIHR